MQFYFKNGEPLSNEMKDILVSKILCVFNDHSDRLSVKGM